MKATNRFIIEYGVVWKSWFNSKEGSETAKIKNGYTGFSRKRTYLFQTAHVSFGAMSHDEMHVMTHLGGGPLISN